MLAHMDADKRKCNILKRWQQSKEKSVDQLSHMSDNLLVKILSLVPTHYAARTSLLSHRFCHLWKACSIISFATRDRNNLVPVEYNRKFISMLIAAIHNRDPSIPLSELHIDCYLFDRCYNNIVISALLVQANFHGLRHLTIYRYSFMFETMSSIIFTLVSLESLSIASVYPVCHHQKSFFPVVSLPRLRSLSMSSTYIENTELNQLISKLSVLENLDLTMNDVYESFGLASHTIKYLRLNIIAEVGLNLNLPALQLLQLESRCWYTSTPHFKIELPLLKKCTLSLHDLDEKDVGIVTVLLHRLSHIEELHLLLTECSIEKMPYHVLLDPDKDVPVFLNLKYLEVTTCFHKLTCKDIISLVINSPVPKSLKLYHQITEFLTEDKKVRKCWRSKLPRNHDGNHRYGYFTNLHLSKNRKDFLKLFNKKLFAKRQIMSRIRDFVFQ